MRDMTHSYMWHASLIGEICLIRIYVWQDSFICVTWLFHMCDMNLSYAWHDSFICVTWLIHVCDMTYSCVWHDSSICVRWLIHMCDMTHSYAMTHSYVWHDSFICVTWLVHWHDSFICVTWLIHMCDMTHSVCRDSNCLSMNFIRVTWLKNGEILKISILAMHLWMYHLIQVCKCVWRGRMGRGGELQKTSTNKIDFCAAYNDIPTHVCVYTHTHTHTHTAPNFSWKTDCKWDV